MFQLIANSFSPRLTLRLLLVLLVIGLVSLKPENNAALMAPAPSHSVVKTTSVTVKGPGAL